MSSGNNATDELVLRTTGPQGFVYSTLVPTVALGTWHHLVMHVVPKGAATGVQIWWDDKSVFAQTVNISATRFDKIQLGAEHDQQMGDIYVDDVIVNSGSETPGPVPGTLPGVAGAAEAGPSRRRPPPGSRQRRPRNLLSDRRRQPSFAAWSRVAAISDSRPAPSTTPPASGRSPPGEASGPRGAPWAPRTVSSATPQGRKPAAWSRAAAYRRDSRAALSTTPRA